MIKKILILAANPSDTDRLRLDKEVREIKEGLRRAKHREQFDISSEWAINFEDLRRALLDHKPQIVHFIGHGDEDGLMLEGELELAVPISSEVLSGLFELCSKHIECVILNACYSALQAVAINKYINYVIGMPGKINDNAAIKFSMGFYDALGADKNVEEAFKFGCNAINQILPDLPEHLIPVLKKRTGRVVQSNPISGINLKKDLDMTPKKRDTCFVIMPFKEPFNTYYKDIIKTALEKSNLIPLRSDEIYQPNSFIQTIWESILASKVIIAEMTGMNPNVLYEMGLCHAINKTVIMLTQNINDVPVDLRHINLIQYDTMSPNWADILTKKILKMIDGSKIKREPYLKPTPDFRFKKLKGTLEKEIHSLKEENELLKSNKKRDIILLQDSNKKIKRLERQNQTFSKKLSDNVFNNIVKVDNKNEGVSYLYPLRSTGLIIELVEIPEGPFIQGPKGGEERIVLSTFYISQFSITNKQFVAFLNETGNQVENGVNWIDLNGKSPADKCRIYMNDGIYYVEEGYENHPVTYINWYGANAFCQWAGGDLPTEAQWEKVARGGDGRFYPWGDQPPNSELTNYTEDGWPRDVAPVPVDRYPKGISPYGCYQMVGNVWHWTSTYYEDRDVQAVRGGSFFDFRVGKREVYRFLVQPDGPDFSQGFHFSKKFL